MTTLEIVRYALPLHITRCELTDYSLHLGGSEWHLNATCPYTITVAERRYSDDSAPGELKNLSRRLIGMTLATIESNDDMDDPSVFLDDGTRISLTADPNDSYEPWTMRVPGILLVGGSPAEIEHAPRTILPGVLTDLGEILRVQNFPPGWSVSTDEWTILVACPWQVEPTTGERDRLDALLPVHVGMRLESVRFSSFRCILYFDGESPVVVTSDAGRTPWFINSRQAGISILGLPIRSGPD
ncbi:hypothetical protein CYJ73_24510 [Gordonia terrae]|uniref:Uncharacterized protein n=1 Tax=Gordonia terrae TaxID=2055 RepID=A0A2I1R1C8_9ACTN|nr:hypothetical protein [Gordonia terrae]PKZ62928.1 hypothetical protein CYJ73_24510 [Gordonia terrae]